MGKRRGRDCSCYWHVCLWVCQQTCLCSSVLFPLAPKQLALMSRRPDSCKKLYICIDLYIIDTTIYKDRTQLLQFFCRQHGPVHASLSLQSVTWPSLEVWVLSAFKSLSSWYFWCSWIILIEQWQLLQFYVFADIAEMDQNASVHICVGEIENEGRRVSMARNKRLLFWYSKKKHSNLQMKWKSKLMSLKLSPN